MPARAKTTDAQIVAAARALIERHGRDGMSLAAVADAVGIRAPSLYNRFADRGGLLAAVEVEVWRELGAVLRGAARANDPIAQLTAIARAYRAYAKAHPRLHALVYDVNAEHSEAGLRARHDTAGVAMPAFVALVGARRALLAARVLTPFLNGFVTMELTGAFRLGPGVDAAFAHGVATILTGLRASARRSRSPRNGGPDVVHPRVDPVRRRRRLARR